jgi:hypothetical protein
MAKVKKAGGYDVHPATAMVARWAAELPAKTGRTLDQWADFLRAECPHAARKDQVAWLKGVHGLGSNTAGFIHAYAFDTATWDGDPDRYLAMAPKYVDAQYAGAKAGLRPIFDAVVAAARSLGRDVKVCPCKTMVPFYRKRSFAEVRASTRTRADLFLALGKFPETDRLKYSSLRVKNDDRLKHVVALTAVGDVDAEVRGWLKAAYDSDG